MPIRRQRLHSSVALRRVQVQEWTQESVKTELKRRAELWAQQQQNSNDAEDGEEQFVGWHIGRERESEQGDSDRLNQYERASNSRRSSIETQDFAPSRYDGSAQSTRREVSALESSSRTPSVASGSEGTGQGGLFRLPDEHLVSSGASWNEGVRRPRGIVPSTSSVSLSDQEPSRRASSDSFSDFGESYQAGTRSQGSGSLLMQLSSSDDDLDLAGLEGEEDNGFLLGDGFEDDLMDPLEDGEYFHMQELAQSRFESLKSFIGQQLRDKGATHANMGGERYLESEKHRLLRRDDMTGEEVAAVALCKRAEAKAAALKDYARELEIQVAEAQGVAARLQERVQVLEVQRVLLGMLVGIAVPTVMGAILSHHYDLHELEATWLVLAAWLLGLYVLLVVLYRLMQRLRSTLDELEMEADAAPVGAVSSSRGPHESARRQHQQERALGRSASSDSRLRSHASSFASSQRAHSSSSHLALFESRGEEDDMEDEFERSVPSTSRVKRRCRFE
ncbi:Hypothetical Protein FCC1311_108572 [Hondaea fermentalgiana]|uniref:Uncharacterized protein n=1 Tax=Hondaea fermentalgiana TaxID=2315210 RepID=A0A2R5GVP0_9STRA|nr:Hypothetical Protein FCC1311_108572 [Hondaea fermentalgiana]|eukprot:GBG34635.1 Hypothetical Protein FCC1311_108572 [Hondaea fermentalgiana]